MSDIVLSASVRQNLLSLQSTADLLSQTQNRLATGNKVNSALDNPTNYFTASSLNNRASDISNLLDGIGNGVQVLQAANTGITSLQKLVDTAKSIANQALQATSGYSTKSQASATITGATAANLLGTTTPATAGTFTEGAFSTVDVSATGAAAAGGTFTAGTFSTVNVGGTGSSASTASTYTAGTFGSDLDLSSGGSISFTLDVDGTSQAITLDSSAVSTFNTNTSGSLTSSALTAQNVADLVNYQLAGGTGSSVPSGPVTVNSGALTIASSASAGSGSVVKISGYTTAGGVTDTTGLADVDNEGQDAVAADALNFSVSVDGSAHNVSISAADLATYNGDSANSASQISDSASALTAADVAKLINYQVGSTVASVSGGGDLTFTSAAGSTHSVATSAVTTAGSATNTTGIALHSAANGTDAGADASLSFSVTVDGTGHNVSISAAALTAYNGDSANSASQITDGASSLSAADVAKLVNYQVGSAVASVDSGTGALKFTSATGSAHSVAVSAVTAAGGATDTTGITSHAAATGTDSSGGLSGTQLTIASTGGGKALTINFGSGSESYDSSTGVASNVSTLDELNTVLADNNLTASIDTTGKLTLTTTNDYSSVTIGALGGTATGGGLFTAGVGSTAVADANAQNARSALVSQYNNVIQQIQTTAQDASFNGVNLLNGDQLKLVFNETGKSTLNIAGVTDDPAGLGLSTLTSGTDFIDNASTNKILDSLNSASTNLRSQASTLGSNLSIVQIRQDFSKNLINVLQTGASNLTLADTNEEAANSQALSTRQSIAVSALSLANQSQQSVLRLLQ